MSSINCSYSNSEGALVEQVCDAETTYCCQASGTKYCSNSPCSSDSGLDFKTIAFWAVLGGLLLVAFVTITLVYFICYARNPRACFSRNPVEELFHQEEVHTVTSETHVPTNATPTTTVVWKTEKTRKVTKKHRSSKNLDMRPAQPITISVTPRDDSGEPLRCNEHRLPVKKVDHLTPACADGLSPRSRQSKVTCIGESSNLT